MYPIDIKGVARKLKCDERILFGRLYYDMRERYKSGNHSIFEPVAGSDRHTVNFPYLVGLLAQIRDDAQRQWLTWTFSLLALVISAFSLLVNLTK